MAVECWLEVHVRIVFFGVLFLIFLSGCETKNSNSLDGVIYSGSDFNENASVFEKSTFIIKRDCISCHSGYHNNWAGFDSEDAWISSGLVNRGDGDNSILIRRIINSGYPSSNMPQGGSTLSASDYDTLNDWINTL